MEERMAEQYNIKSSIRQPILHVNMVGSTSYLLKGTY